MDSDRRSSGELVIDEDAIIGSPRSEASESTITRNRNVESVLMNNNHTEPDTSITNFAQPKGMKRKRSPATKRTTARAKKAAAETNSKNKRVANTQVTNQLTKKMHYFKLNTLKDLKTTSLSVSAKLHQFYNMQLSLLPHNTLGAEVIMEYPMAPPMEEISLNQVLNWPGIGVILSLRDMTYIRRTVPHYEHSIVIGSDSRINLDLTENVTKIRRLVTMPDQKPGPLISKEVLETCISAIEASVQLVDVSRARSAELLAILQMIKQDIEPLESVCAKTLYSKYPNQQKYMRIFENDIEKSSTRRRQVAKTFLRETINPEVLFEIERCTFFKDNQSSWENGVSTFFENLFIKKDQITKNMLRDAFKKCVSFVCLICNKRFDGVLCMYATKAHIATHFFNKDWSCTKCDQAWSQFDLTQSRWVHNCNSEHAK